MSIAARHTKVRGKAVIALAECERLVDQAHHEDDANQFLFMCERWRDILRILDAPDVEQKIEIGVFTRGLNGEKPKPHKARAHLTLVKNNA